MLNSKNNSNKISTKLEFLRSLSETISEANLALIEKENPGIETLAISAMELTPRFNKKDLLDLGIDTMPDFMLNRSLFASEMNRVRRFRTIKKLTSNIDQQRDQSPSSLREVHNFAIDFLGFDEKRFFCVGDALKVHRIVRTMLSCSPHPALKIYYDFQNNMLTSVPNKGDCLQISNITFGYKNGNCVKLTQKMYEGKSFKEAMVEIIKFDLKRIYLKLLNLEQFTFTDYRKRKVPLSLVDEDSLKANLLKMNVASIRALLHGRSDSDKKFIVDTFEEIVMNSSSNLYP